MDCAIGLVGAPVGSNCATGFLPVYGLVAEGWEVLVGEAFWERIPLSNLEISCEG